MMKRITHLLLSLLFLSIGAYGQQDSKTPPCDSTFHATLRVGQKYHFTDTFVNHSKETVYLQDYKAELKSNDPKLSKKIVFDWTEEARGVRMRANPGQKVTYVKSTEWIPFSKGPEQRAEDNVTGYYQITFSGDKHGLFRRTYTTCVKYAVSSCGDGVLDKQFKEECDDGNRTSGDGCSSDCKKE